MSNEQWKREAARAAVEREVRSGMTLGLGTGSTVAHALDALGEALREWRLENVRGVPTSEQTAARARELGIPLLELHEAGELDVTIDGADEIDTNLDLIKGLGGALLREKMVAQATRRLVIIADGGKRVERLGQKAPVPVEVVPFGWRAHLPFLESLGARPVLREEAGEPYRTDNGNYVIDCHFEPEEGILDPQVLDWQLLGRAGIVEHGLFLDMAAIAYVAGPGGLVVLDRD
ncbi:MAG TPA: ribose-5-phosphate isomerase RpiA [Ardenticatenaceae bacterium]